MFTSGIVVVGVVMVVALWSASPLVAVSGSAGSLRLTLAAGPVPKASEYAVTFTETGLPSGTSWSVTLNGTPQDSTGASMVFYEPNGAYLFTVGSIPGYTVNPEGNVTVHGAPVSVPIMFVATGSGAPSCPSFYWAGDNNTLRGNCIGFFEDDYRAFNASTGWTTDNSTFTVGPLAEVTPSGAVVALGIPGFEGSGSVTTVRTPHEVNVTDTIVGNVTNAIGLNSSTSNPNGETPEWTPADAAGGGGSTTWGSGSQVLGGTTLGITFHFENGSGSASDRVKFDVTVSGWPWVSSNDALGLEVEAGAYALPGGVHFVYTAATDTIAQESDSNNSAIWSLAFGPTATITGSSPSTVRVTDQVGLFPNGNATPTVAIALLTFEGPGGYAGLAYDPWVLFGPQGPVTVVPPPSPLNNGASLPLVAVGAITLVAAVLGVAAFRLRRRPIDEGLWPAV
jgi:hypothetical protein